MQHLKLRWEEIMKYKDMVASVGIPFILNSIKSRQLIRKLLGRIEDTTRGHDYSS